MRNRIKVILAENAAAGISPKSSRELALKTGLAESEIGRLVSGVNVPGVVKATQVARALGHAVEDVFPVD